MHFERDFHHTWWKRLESGPRCPGVVTTRLFTAADSKFQTSLIPCAATLLIFLVLKVLLTTPHNFAKVIMKDVDQFEFQAKYRQYISTQQRVSEWVSGTGSQTRSLRRKASSSRHISTKSSPAHSSGRSARRSKDTGCAISTAIGRQRAEPLGSGPQSISPAITLISSTLFICAFLPSLLTLSAFVLFLTYAGSLETKESSDERKHFQC